MSARIYVSSTFLDLRPYREAVRDAIRGVDQVDVAMEYYVAEPLRPVVRCLDDVRRCDLYVGIFARRYGYVPPGSELSITEQEYRAAEKHGKDMLCFLLRDDVQWPAEYTDTDVAAERVKALRNRISSTNLAGYFATPDELATKVGAAVVKALKLGTTPLDTEREHRLMKEWREGKQRMERARARQALLHMGSPRYAAAIKDLLVAATDANQDVDAIASYMEELLTLSVTSKEAMPIFLDLLHVGDVSHRQLAVFHIGELGLRGKDLPSQIVLKVLELQDDSSPTVRAELAHTLGKIRHRDASVSAVRACLTTLGADADATVRARAEESLRQIE